MSRMRLSPLSGPCIGSADLGPAWSRSSTPCIRDPRRAPVGAFAWHLIVIPGGETDRIADQSVPTSSLVKHIKVTTNPRDR
jgi:hypothetical protein